MHTLLVLLDSSSCTSKSEARSKGMHRLVGLDFYGFGMQGRSSVHCFELSNDCKSWLFSASAFLHPITLFQSCYIAAWISHLLFCFISLHLTQQFRKVLRSCACAQMDGGESPLPHSYLHDIRDCHFQWTALDERFTVLEVASFNGSLEFVFERLLRDWNASYHASVAAQSFHHDFEG